MQPSIWPRLLIVLLGTAVVPFDSAVNVAFPAIVSHFHLPISAIQWVVIAYTLTYAALTLICGRLGDVIGHKRVFLAGAAISLIGFLGDALAPVFGGLLIARIVQGIGAALLLSCGAALATALYPETARVRILGLYTMAFGLGGAAGPLLAGPLVGQFGWSSVFWFRVPLAAMAAIGGLFLPPSAARNTTARFDAAGGVLFVAAVSAFVLALGEAQPGAGGWLPGLTLAAAATLAMALFLRRQTRTAQPIINVSLFRARDFRAVNGANLLLNLAAFALLLLLPFYLDRVAGLGARATGVLLALSPGGLVVAAPLAARLAGGLGRGRLARIGAGVLAGGQVLVLVAIATRVPPALLGGAMALVGLGLGLFQLAYFDLVTGSMPLADRGVAGSLVMMTRTLGLVIGASVLMLVFRRLGGGGTAGFMAGLEAALSLAAIVALAAVAWLWQGLRANRELPDHDRCAGAKRSDSGA